MNIANRFGHRYRKGRFVAVVMVGAIALAACGGTSAAAPAPTGTAAPSGATAPTGSAVATTGASSSAVLPVASNPIVNTSPVQALKIDSVLVENNVDSSGKIASDHLEIALSNTGTTELTGFEVFYTFADSTAGISESYYAQLPDTFTIPSGGQRIAHFDNTGAPDHFPVNDFSLYYTSSNALEVTVTVSAANAAQQTVTVKKDAGGTETAD